MTDPLVTKEGIRVEVGQVWRDLDKRQKNRQCRVIEVAETSGQAKMQRVVEERSWSQPVTWVSVRRMHKHSTGWELVVK